MATKKELIERARSVIRNIRKINEDDDAIPYAGGRHGYQGSHGIPEWTAIGEELESIKAGCGQEMKDLDTPAWDQELWDLGVLCQKYSEYALIQAMIIAEPLQGHSHIRTHGQQIGVIC